ncbi:M23 family metallopeptidase [Sphingobacterium sp. HSC-15S19]|uniref:M23 family metallopeptidase n=1 Tax=Sphingobacterium TaxID=28453 RepID=UPI003D1F1AD2
MGGKDGKYRLYFILLLLFLSKVATAQNNSPKQITLYSAEGVAPQQDSAEVPKEKLNFERPQELGMPIVAMPLAHYSISSGFGWRTHPVTGIQSFHNGIDLAATAQVVYCILPGRVESTGYHQHLGKFVCVDHGFVFSIYGHLSRIAVINGEYLQTGFPIGITGNTGRTTGEHLHFSMRRKNIYIDPWKFLYGLTHR